MLIDITMQDVELLRYTVDYMIRQLSCCEEMYRVTSCYEYYESRMQHLEELLKKMTEVVTC